MKLLKLNTRFIEEHIDELIQLVDYVPISFKDYNHGYERDKFLKSKNLLITMQEMDELIRQKCNHYEDPVKAYNSVLIEWLDCHPEFENIIAAESIDEYRKNTKNFIEFIDLLYDVKLPFEKKEWTPSKEGIRDDSIIQLPNFKKKNEIFDEYGATLLSCYLSYLV